MMGLGYNISAGLFLLGVAGFLLGWFGVRVLGFFALPWLFFFLVKWVTPRR